MRYDLNDQQLPEDIVKPNWDGEDIIKMMDEVQNWQSPYFDNENEDLWYNIGTPFMEFTLPLIGEFKVLKAWRGDREYGDDLGYVIQHVESGRIFYRSGQWNSYGDGDTWDANMIEVEEADVTVRRYRSVDTGLLYGEDL